ncbi:CAAX amino protease [Companilactobacillus sp. RD055328]|uniref:CPBP family intramembrane glutamic endopeptidase n=1 Tax=Companilactobacillus sp. RD055328 TaxID=2916634 RepID=UPI001FC874DA|nr:type II CAAX endopeptidase family protein [Companilactobacillus sp. RD055328]GKQ42895.1 CAAX amino protease [Companilactobacillus sp. RD055328]
MKTLRNVIIILGFYLLQQIPVTLMTLPPFGKGQNGLYLQLAVIILSMILIPLFMLGYYHRINHKYKNPFTKYTILIIIVAIVINVLINKFSLPYMQPTGNANVDALSAIFKNFPVVMLFYSVIIGPITEEILSRGLLMNMFFVNRPYVSLILSSTIFGLMHGSNDPVYLISKIALGFVLGFTYLKTKNIKANIVVHIANNVSAFMI